MSSIWDLYYNEFKKPNIWGIAGIIAGAALLILVIMQYFVSFAVFGNLTVSKDVLVDGKVGIGTRTPTEKLHVVGDVLIDGNLLLKGTQTIQNINTSNSEQLLITNDGTGPAVVVNQLGAEDIMQIQDDGTTVMIIKDGGNVGFGTTDPRVRVHVQAGTSGSWSSSSGMRVGGGGANAGYLQMGADTSGATVGRGWIHTFRNGVGGEGSGTYTNLCLQEAGGNVGVGTINPSDTLHVVGSGIKFGDTGAAVNQTRIYSGATFSGWQTQNGINAISVLQSNGNVGIGTTNPTSAFVVSRTYGSATGRIGFDIESNISSTYSSTIDVGNDGMVFWPQSSVRGFVFKNGIPGSEVTRAVITSGGNVGIGITNPASKLYLFDDAVISNVESKILATFNGNKSVWDNNTYLGIQLGAGVTQWQIGTTRNTPAGDWDLRFYNDIGTSIVSFGGNGNVGIGITNPAFQLQTTNQVAIRYQAGVSGGLILGSSPGNRIAAVNSSGTSDDLILNADGGNVGVGLSNPGYPLTVYGTPNSVSGTLTFFRAGDTGIINSTTSFTSVSISSQHSIWVANGGGFIASSDRRIKENIAEINDGDALAKLRALNPSTYNYIDKVNRTSDKVYGFIAQEVKEVLPHAVSIQKEFIPNIYSLGTLASDNLTISLDNSKPHGLVVNAKVRIYKESSTQPLVCEVAEIISGQQFRVKEEIVIENSDRVFVYGSEVEDFHTLDKDVIFTVGVAAAQELDRKVTKLESELSELKALLIQKGVI